MLNELEGLLGHQFNQIDLLRVALTHRSYYFENRKSSTGHFERMEFLGDAVLDLVLSESLMCRYPDADEGILSKWRASLVNEQTLSEIAKNLQVAKFLFLGKSENRQMLRARLLSSAFEAITAAIYLDAGLDKVRSFIDAQFLDLVSKLDGEVQFATDYKTRLQEFTQKHLKMIPEYRLVESVGPEHAKQFRYQVFVKDELHGEGIGPSRKQAEQQAAQKAFEHLTLEEEK